MKLISSHNKLELNIENSLIEKIGAIAIKHFPNEYGGFLIGEYTSDYKSVEITDFILPKEYTATPSFFQRSTKNIKNYFIKLFKEKSQYYVGEWHSHPNGSTKSSHIDLKAMREIVKCSTVKIKNPILFIVSINEKKIINYTFYCYNNNQLFPYE